MIKKQLLYKQVLQYCEEYGFGGEDAIEEHFVIMLVSFHGNIGGSY